MSDTQLATQLCAKHVRHLQPYESARRLFSGGEHWLNANESPFANAYQVDDSSFNRYPECQPAAVIAAYAKYAGVDPELVLASRGADEGIELLIRGFCDAATDYIAVCPPTYGMYAISAHTAQVGVRQAPLRADFSLDMAALADLANSATPPKLVFICSPNNPTGTLIAREDLRQILALFAGVSLVVVDEAYIEFQPSASWAKEIPNHPNLVVLRTLSKGFALAGIRCGFVLAQASILSVLLKVIAPYPVSEPVAQIAAQALAADGIARMQAQVATLQAERSKLAEQCAACFQWQTVGADHGNFLLFRVPEKQPLMAFLVANGMLIRDQSKQINLDNCLRISIGNATENATLIALTKQFYATAAGATPRAPEANAKDTHDCNR